MKRALLLSTPCRIRSDRRAPGLRNRPFSVPSAETETRELDTWLKSAENLGHSLSRLNTRSTTPSAPAPASSQQPVQLARTEGSKRAKKKQKKTIPDPPQAQIRTKTDQITGNKRKLDSSQDQQDDSSSDPSSKRQRISLPRPSRPKYRNNDVNKKARTSLKQPMTVLDPQKPTPYTLPQDWQKVVDQVHHDDPKAPERVEVDKLRQFTKVPIKKLGVDLTGGNQGGLFPEDDSMVTKLPESSDYKKSRPQQILSQLSEVIRHRAEEEDQNPVEVQFGYGKKKDGGLDLFTSTNNKESQEWLLEALKSPLDQVKKAAKSDDPEVTRRALKILFQEEQNKERRKQIGNDPHEKELGEQLDLAEKIREQFLAGPTKVVVNTAKRHAEQNISDALHEMEDYEEADIQGTMIRCEGCSSELGINLKDQHGKGVIGRVYASQAEKSRHQKTLDEVRHGRARIATNRSHRSRSTSPPRLPLPETKKEKKKRKRDQS